MKNTTTLLFISIATLAISQVCGTLSAMQPDQNRSPLKRSKAENLALVPTKIDYTAALDAALLKIDEDGNTVLHAAASMGDLDTCRQLLARGANSCAQNQTGNSPLHSAVLGNHHEVTQQLINGMPKHAKRKRIITALCVLKRNNFPKVLLPWVFGYLPELVVAYPALCKRLVPTYIAQEQLINAQHLPRLMLLSLKNTDGLTAYDIAKGNRNGFMARMTNPKNSMKLCQEKIHTLLTEDSSFENNENKE